MAELVTPLQCEPGIQRDGTTFASTKWSDGANVRFQRGLPRKIGGYIMRAGLTTSNPLIAIPRAIFIFPQNNTTFPSPPYASNPPTQPPPQVSTFYVYVCNSEGIKYYIMDQNGVAQSNWVDRTPTNWLSDYSEELRSQFLFTIGVYSTPSSSGGDSPTDYNVIVHGAPNLVSINQTFKTPLYYGPVEGVTPLIPLQSTLAPAAPYIQYTCGGFVILYPYLCLYDSEGQVTTYKAGDPTTIINIEPITTQKIVTAAATRAGTSSPGGLFWSTDTLKRATFSGNPDQPFIFDTVSGDISIMSSKCVVEYDGLFYWCATNRFLVYNGIVQEVPNYTNLNYFFENVNYAQREKVWGTKIPHFGEIWWFFPMGTSTECNHVVIYNVREQSWYDTPMTRSCGVYDQNFESPLWCDNTPNPSYDNQYAVWQQEADLDETINGTVTPINAYITTTDLGFIAQGNQQYPAGFNKWLYLNRIELDLIQTNQMNLTVTGQSYPRAPDNNPSIAPTQDTYTFQPTDVKIDLHNQARFMTLTFQSNIAGGYFEMGKNLLTMKLGDTRP